LSLLLFSACSNGNDENNQSVGGAVFRTHNMENIPYTYIYSTIFIGDDIRGIPILTQVDGVIYGAGFHLDEHENTIFQFFSVDIGGGENFLYPLLATDELGTSLVVAMAANSSGEIFFIEKMYFLEAERAPTQTLKRMDRSGNILLSVDITEKLDDHDYVIEIQVDKYENIYLQTYAQVLVFEPSGSQKFNVEILGDSFNPHTIFLKFDGSVVLPVRLDGEMTLHRIGLETHTFEVVQEIPSANFYKPSLRENEILLLTNNSVYTYSLLDETQTEIFRWHGLDLNPFEISRFYALNDEQYTFLHILENRMPTQLSLLTRVESSEDTREVVTLASIFPNYPLIRTFNQQSTYYRIEVIDYSSLIQGFDISSAITRLQADLISGQSVDILDLIFLPHLSYARGGFLADMNVFFGQDTELDRSMLLPRITELLEVGESLYYITPGFTIVTSVGPSSAVGEMPGMSLNELSNMEKQLNDGESLLRGMSALSFIEQYILINWESLIDYETGMVHFDAEAFIRVLEYAAALEQGELLMENPFQEDLRRGEVSLATITINDLSALHEMELVAGTQITAIGFPSRDGVGSMMLPTSLYGIGAGAENRSGAWEFIRFLLSVEQQREIDREAIPVLQLIFDERIQELMQPIPPEQLENPHLAGGIWVDGTLIELEPMSEEHANRLLQIINTLSRGPTGHESIVLDIVFDTTNAFLNGSRTAQETARIIQNRVSTYVQEQHWG